MVRTTLFARPALALAAALVAVTGAGMVNAPAHAQTKPPEPLKLKLSKPFQTLAAPLSKGIEDSKKRPDVIAARQGVDAARTAYDNARGNAARAQAKPALDASVAALGGLLTTEKGQLEAAYAAATSADDRYVAGQMAIQLGAVGYDNPLQRRGLQSMIDSAKVTGHDLARLNFSLGSLAYDARDFALARTALTAAVNGGYRENNAAALLADAYLVDNQVPQGIQLLRKAIADEIAAGRNPPANWYRRGLGVSYSNKLVDDSTWFSTGLVERYPSKENWAGAISIVREVARYPAQETLDLMRLMHRTGSFIEERDYVEYIEAADGRRSPGEVLKIITLGTTAGKLRLGDVFVAEQKKAAEGRLAADRASLPSLERDARIGSATAATAMAAADAFLSYDQAAKAAELYQIALGKPGVDTARALTRLGIAQADLGQYAEAQATFGKITGPRKALAQLWSLYARSKAAPAAPAAPASK